MAELNTFIEEIPERYTDVELIGRGGMGVVLKAKDKTLDKYVAIKMLHSSLEGDKVARFQLEAKALGRLKNRNILDVLDFGISKKEYPYFVMEFIEGKDLGEFIEEEYSLSLDRALPIFLGVADGLSYAHKEGVIHRDIKPSNIVLLGDSELSGNSHSSLKIIDFGLAKLSNQEQQITKTGLTMGSPLYMSPEQVRAHEVTEKSDVYSFGCLIFKLLTGQEPVKGDTAIDTMNLKLKTPAPLISTVDDSREFPTGLEALLANMLSLDPGDRKSMDEVYRELLDIQAGFDSDETKEHSNEFEEAHEKLNSKSNILIVLLVVLLAVGMLALFALPLLFSPSSPTNVSKIEKQEEQKATIVGKFNMPENLGSIKVLSKHHIGIKTKLNGGNDYDLDLIRGHTEIRDLELEETDISAAGLKRNLVGLVDLTDLDLSKSNIDNQGLREITALKGLVKLSLRGCENISDEGLEALHSLKKLETINLEHTKITRAGLETLSKIKSLTFLDLRGTSLDTKDFEPLQNLPELESVFIGGTDTKISDLRPLTKLKKLSGLTLESIDADYGVLSELPELAYLTFEGIDIPSGFVNDLKKIKKLEILAIKYPRQDLSVELLKSIGSVPNLTNLRLTRIKISRDNLSGFKYLRPIPKVVVSPTYGSMEGVKESVEKLLPQVEFSYR